MPVATGRYPVATGRYPDAFSGLLVLPQGPFFRKSQFLDFTNFELPLGAPAGAFFVRKKVCFLILRALSGLLVLPQGHFVRKKVRLWIFKSEIVRNCSS